MFSVSRLGALLARRPDGSWIWQRSGLPAPQIRDVLVHTLVPKFPRAWTYLVGYIEIHDRWRTDPLLPWSGDATIGAAIDWHARRGIRAQLLASAFGGGDSLTGARRPRVPGALVLANRWAAFTNVALPAWDDVDGPKILDQAIAESFITEPDDIGETLKRTLSMFYRDPDAFTHPAKAAAAWARVEVLVRQRWSDPQQFAASCARLWRWIPRERLETMTDVELAQWVDWYAIP